MTQQSHTCTNIFLYHVQLGFFGNNSLKALVGVELEKQENFRGVNKLLQ